MEIEHLIVLIVNG